MMQIFTHYKDKLKYILADVAVELHISDLHFTLCSNHFHYIIRFICIGRFIVPVTLMKFICEGTLERKIIVYNYFAHIHCTGSRDRILNIFLNVILLCIIDFLTTYVYNLLITCTNAWNQKKMNNLVLIFNLYIKII